MGFAHDERHIDPFLTQNMLEALQESQAIYFYRRIYNPDTLVLQARVQKVCASLACMQAMGACLPYGSASFIWPAFIAACEAEDLDTQFSFSQWFEHYAQKSGLPAFKSALGIVQQVWWARSSPDGANTTWLDLMKLEHRMRQRQHY